MGVDVCNLETTLVAPLCGQTPIANDCRQASKTFSVSQPFLPVNQHASKAKHAKGAKHR